MQWRFNTPKTEPLSCVTNPIQKEKIEIVVLSVLNVLGISGCFDKREILFCKVVVVLRFFPTAKLSDNKAWFFIRDNVKSAKL